MNHVRYRATCQAALVASAIVALGACGGGSSTSSNTTGPTPPPSVMRQVVPSTTDAAINIANEPHYAANPSPTVTARGKLFVFLPGTGALPAMYQEILQAGVARGYHAIGLNYPNPTAIGVLCADDVDADCFWDARREVISGVNFSARLDVNVANSIVNRLAKAIAYLDAQSPREGWGQFVTNGAVNWSMVTLGGHSQGGGHAGVMAKLVALDRAVYFSSPADWRSVANAPATWVNKPNVTDASRQFGFAHVQDQLVPYSHLQAIWPALGMQAYGAMSSVDGASAPYGGSHQLTTLATPLIAGSYHSATVADAATPRTTGGSALFTPVWTYLAFP